MVTRGLQLPSVKKMYIVRDAKREADRQRIPFGELCDPIGTGVENCIALAHFAEARGKQLAFVKSAMRGIWAEARDMSEYVDLRYVVERAELPWAEAKDALGAPEALKWATEGKNHADAILLNLGLNNIEAAKTSITPLGGTCASCHGKYRERMDDGTFRLKTAG